MRGARYYVTTWDSDRQEFTPQQGIRTGPYTLFGLRRPLRALRALGYEAARDDPSVFVERRGPRLFRAADGEAG